MAHRIRTWLASCCLVGLALLTGCRAWPLGRANSANWGKNSGGGSQQSPGVKDRARPLLGQKNRNDIQTVIAQSFENHGHFDKAIQAYQAILQSDPNNADILQRLAVLHDKNGQTEHSRALYQKALALAPQNASLLCDCGYSCYLQGRLPEAEALTRQALALEPKLLRAHGNLGMIYGRSGRGEMALQEFSLAGCSMAEARNNLAVAMSLENQLVEAQHEYALALQADPKLSQAQSGQRQLSRVLAQMTAPPPGPGETAGPAFQVAPAGFQSQ